MAPEHPDPASSDDEDTSSGEEQKVESVHRPIKNSWAPARQESEGDEEDDDEGDSEASEEQEEEDPGDDPDGSDEDYEVQEEDSDTDSDSHGPGTHPTKARGNNVPSLLKRPAAAAGLAESSTSNKRARRAPALTKGPAADAPSGAEDGQGDDIKGLEEKSAAYWYLRQEVEALEADYKQPAGMFDAALLKMNDAKAAMLDNKVKRQRVAECKVMNKRWDIKKQVTGVLCNLIKKK